MPPRGPTENAHARHSPLDTGRKIDIDVLGLFQIRDERRVEHWALLDNLDNLGMLKQLGAA